MCFLNFRSEFSVNAGINNQRLKTFAPQDDKFQRFPSFTLTTTRVIRRRARIPREIWGVMEPTRRRFQGKKSVGTGPSIEK